MLATSFHLVSPFSGLFGDITSAMAGLYLIGFAAPAFEAVSSRKADEQSHQPPTESHHPIQHSHHSVVTVPAELSIRLPQPGTRPRRDVLRALIVDLCAWQPQSARDLAAILRRQEHKPLVRDHLSPMVAEGRLAYTIPEMENHPDQRYTAPAIPVSEKNKP